MFSIGPLGLLRSWFFYFACVMLFSSMGGWLYRLNAALGKYDPLFIIPLLQSFYVAPPRLEPPASPPALE